ncbi:MAG: Type 3 secretion system secretin [Chlamydiia bacterium]|nr:Type 3 secretion system secretin [Chlamydiia bacterium]
MLGKRNANSIVSSVTIAGLIFASPGMSVFADDKIDDSMQPSHERLVKRNSKKPGYTINFNNVSIKEYLKFISKIAELNFVYDETELEFNVTIVSEEPTDLSNVLAALVQVLRIHGFSLIDDGVNLVINKGQGLHQIATIVSDELPFDSDMPPAIVTRVFKIKNANPDSVASIIEPMLSGSAQIENSSESRHIIVTDTTANVDKVADLLLTLDAPNSPLDIDAYTTQNNSVQNLVTLTSQIITPLSEGNPVILVPQEDTNTIFIVSTPFLIEKTLAVLDDLDSQPIALKQKVLTGANVLLYRIQYRSASVVETSLEQISQNLEQLGYTTEGLLETLETAKYIPETHSMLFTGEPQTLKKVNELLTSIDAPGKPLAGSHNSAFYIYKAQYKTPEQLANLLDTFGTDLDESNFTDLNLINTIKTLKIMDSINSILLTGDELSIKELEGVIKTLDVPTNEQIEQMGEKFLIYKVKNGTEEQIAKSFSNLADNLEESKFPDRDLIDAIDSLKWIKETNSLVFTGTEASLKQIKEILPTFDIAPNYTRLDQLPESSEFYLYTPKHLKGQELLHAVESLTTNLQESGLANPALLQTLESARWIPSSGALVFTGGHDSLTRVKSLMPTIDIDTIEAKHKPIIYIYQTKFVDPEELSHALENLSDNLPATDEVGMTIKNMKVAAESDSLVFKGPGSSIDKLKEILSVIDTQRQAELAKSEQMTYFIYKLKNVAGQSIMKDMVNVERKLKSSGLGNQDILQAIQSMEWIKSTNSIYASGRTEALQKVKDLLNEFDIQSEGETPSSYFIFKPQVVTPQETLQQIQAIGDGMQKSGLANPELINTIMSAQVVAANDTLVFTGTEKSIADIKDIIATLEHGEASSIQQFGKKTFLIYKLKYVPATQLLTHLRTVAGDLVANKADEDAVVDSLDTARYIPNTNTIIFTGSKSTLKQVLLTAEQFDSEALAPLDTGPPEGYVVYQPESLSPQELIHIMHDFEQQLLHSGVEEPSLFQTINNLKYMEKTNSIIISGSKDSVEKVQDLLTRFDIPTARYGTDEPEIDTIDDVSFLIYKLKYHEGTEIEDALKKVAADLAKTKLAQKNEKLIEAIKSIQWIQITNSLIGTGAPATLGKLKHLIENIDVPLTQIFIEVLVVETDLTNVLNFGLRWGSQGQYRSKLGYATGAFPQYPTGSSGGATDPFSTTFNDNLNTISATDTPTGTTMPFSTGFGLGVIGDIIYHKGKSYSALGSLLDALRQDGDTTIVLSQKVVTQDNKPTTIFTGDNIPFTGSNVQNAGSNATVVTSNIEYKDIGVTLNLTPRVGNNQLITLDIDQEISEDLNSGDSSSASTGGDAGSGNISAPNTFGISTSKTTMQTQATVPDRHFLVLSGVMRNQRVKQRTGIPCLGGLPIIGAAFSRTNTQIVKKNVIIFVRPEIIETIDDFKMITERQTDLFRSQSQAEDFDKALELVQTPDDG